VGGDDGVARGVELLLGDLPLFEEFAESAECEGGLVGGVVRAECALADEGEEDAGEEGEEDEAGDGGEDLDDVSAGGGLRRCARRAGCEREGGGCCGEAGREGAVSARSLFGCFVDLRDMLGVFDMLVVFVHGELFDFGFFEDGVEGFVLADLLGDEVDLA